MAASMAAIIPAATPKLFTNIWPETVFTALKRTDGEVTARVATHWSPECAEYKPGDIVQLGGDTYEVINTERRAV